NFRRVTLSGGQRGGVLTHASLLTATPNPTSTSPVKRGHWVLHEMLCAAPPPPPGNVSDLAGNVDLSAPKRTQLAQHRENPVCASCHLVMDPIGLGFENYNPIGAWRTMDGSYMIDPAGSLPPDQYFSNSLELRTLIKSDRDFPNCVAE